MDFVDKNKKLLNSAFKIQHVNYQACLAPEGFGTCDRDIIKAHSIQNKQILEEIQDDGHVVMLLASISGPKSVNIEFKKIGRNKATIFTGLCKYHDNLIFAPIEKDSIDIENPQHLFLLAYRAITKQTHSLMTSAHQAKLLFDKKTHLGLIENKDDLSEEEYMLTRTFLAYKLHLYKQEYDNIYLNQNYGDLCHEIIKIKQQKPTIAVNAFFSFQREKMAEKNRGGVALNVFPKGDETIVIFSFLCKEKSFVLPHINSILSTSREQQENLLSKLILRYCENFVINPNHFESFSKTKKEMIKKYFIDTLFHDDVDVNGEEINLF